VIDGGTDSKVAARVPQALLPRHGGVHSHHGYSHLHISLGRMGQIMSNWQRRVPIVALILLLVYLAGGGLRSSGSNNTLLHRAIAQNQALIDQTNKLLDENAQDEKDLKALQRYLRDLREVIDRQNKELKAHGFQPVPVPAAPTIAPRPSSSPQPKPRPTSSSSPRSPPPRSPPPRPRPSPSPTKSCTLHNPVTGECIVHQVSRPHFGGESRAEA
jgi:hypothetical protein